MMMGRAFATRERTAFFLCNLAGLVVLVLLRRFWWASWAGAMIAYNCFFAWLILFDEKKRRLSHSVFGTISGHLFCVGMLIAFKFLIAMAITSFSRSQPVTAFMLEWYFRMRILRILFLMAMYGMAFWERSWLFGGESNGSQGEPKGAAPSMFSLEALLGPKPSELQPATGADHEAWVQYRAQNRISYDPRYSVKDDFERWLRKRGKSMYSVATDDRTASGD